MTVAQLEYADAYHDPLPLSDTMDRMKQLCIDREWNYDRLDRKRSALRAVDRLGDYVKQASRASLVNEADQAARRLREIEGEIVEVARQIVAEADNSELIAERNTE